MSSATTGTATPPRTTSPTNTNSRRRRNAEQQSRERGLADAGPILRPTTAPRDAAAPRAVPGRLHEPLERAAGRSGLGRGRRRSGGLEPNPSRSARGRRLGAGARATFARPDDRRDSGVRRPRGRGVRDSGSSQPTRETRPAADEQRPTETLRRALDALTAAR